VSKTLPLTVRTEKTWVKEEERGKGKLVLGWVG
jgi:hypothetical protein